MARGPGRSVAMLAMLLVAVVAVAGCGGGSSTDSHAATAGPARSFMMGFSTVPRELMDVNYMGAFLATKAVLRHMRARRSGHIVNVSSVVGKMSFPFHGAYSATKFALIAMTESLRGELEGSGVTATVVLPASTRTEFFDVQRTNDGHVSAPTGPQQDADQVARAIVRSVFKPTPEVNMVRPFRIAYGLSAFFPFLRDFAGRQFYRRSNGKPRRMPDAARESGRRE